MSDWMIRNPDLYEVAYALDWKQHLVGELEEALGLVRRIVGAEVTVIGVLEVDRPALAQHLGRFCLKIRAKQQVVSAQRIAG